VEPAIAAPRTHLPPQFAGQRQKTDLRLWNPRFIPAAPSAKSHAMKSFSRLFAIAIRITGPVFRAVWAPPEPPGLLRAPRAFSEHQRISPGRSADGHL